METKTISNTCKLITGLSNQTVNLFQDESNKSGNFTRNHLQQKRTMENHCTAINIRTNMDDVGSVYTMNTVFP